MASHIKTPDVIIWLQIKLALRRVTRREVVENWYRSNLKQEIPPIIAKWEQVLGVTVSFWGVKKMRVKWGSCNINDKRIWINLEMAKKPPECLEYIIAHEMVHLIERHHNERFMALMDQHLPSWRHTKDLLNQLPVAGVEYEP